MTGKAKLLVCSAAAMAVSGCTHAELQSFALGAAVATIALNSAQDDEYYRPPGPQSCPVDFTLRLGYDDNGEPYYYCDYDY